MIAITFLANNLSIFQLNRAESIVVHYWVEVYAASPSVAFLSCGLNYFILKMNSKLYADVVSGSTTEEESGSQLSNTLWWTYQMEDEEDAMKRAIANSMVSEENLKWFRECTLCLTSVNCTRHFSIAVLGWPRSGFWCFTPIDQCQRK